LVYGIELAKRCPEVSFILDHIAKPDIKNRLMEPWRGGIRELARLPNVVCKVSGVITEANHAHWTKDELKPYLATVIEAFGFDRLMFGSDWTVSRLTHPYPVFVEILDEVLAGATEAERRKFYCETAIRAYRL
jgi:L-fuconolactonase